VLEEHVFEAKLGDQTLIFKTGKIARLAGGSLLLQSGDTVLLATATMSRNPREGIDFFPLTCNFEERLYAAGRIPGSFFRREGRPSEQGILVSRLIDRPLRPLFPKDFHNDVQVIVQPLSQGESEYSDVLAITAASCALMISDIPFDGPVGGVRIGLIDGELVVNPNIQQMEESTLDLRIAGSAEAISMVEAGADIISEATMLDALELAHQSIQDVIRVQNEMQAAVGKPKRDDYVRFGMPEALMSRAKELMADRVKELVSTTQLKGDRTDSLTALEDELKEALAEEAEANGWSSRLIGNAFHNIFKETVRERILSEGIRPDGRDQHTIRELEAEVHLVPRPHGSGLFTRGETQVLSLATGHPGHAWRKAGDGRSLPCGDQELHPSLQLPAVLHR